MKNSFYCLISNFTIPFNYGYYCATVAQLEAEDFILFYFYCMKQRDVQDRGSRIDSYQPSVATPLH